MRRALSEVRAGSSVRVASTAGLPTGLRERLEAYGLAPGHVVEVIQQRPLTVVRIGHTDLALETSLARGVTIELDAGAESVRRRRLPGFARMVDLDQARALAHHYGGLRAHAPTGMPTTRTADPASRSACTRSGSGA